jgi:transcriptional regulator with PAS, ATPase and Fis domain
LYYPLQAKILNVLQSRTIVKVGDNKPIPVDIRLISATNRNLQESVRKGEFREDLLYRINTIQVEIPPLRERKEDIPLLAEFFLKKYARKYNRENITLSDESVEKLKEYSWHGNVRELQHTLEKAIILSDTGVLQACDFYLDHVAPAGAEIPETLDESEKRLILNSLKRNRENLSAVAAELGICRPTLYSKMKKYGFI